LSSGRNLGLNPFHMPTLYVIRHGQPALTGVLLGQSDPPLSSQGRAQASGIRIPDCRLYSSPLLRARETALMLKPDAIVLTDLAEISYGEWDGLAWSEIENRWPQLAQDKLRDWQSVVPPFGETWEQFTARVNRALREIIQEQIPAAIVAHEAVNAIVANYFAKSSVNAYSQSYCEIKEYEF
jgi:alpha-ribazole phosphatase